MAEVAAESCLVNSAGMTCEQAPPVQWFSTLAVHYRHWGAFKNPSIQATP